MYGYRRIHASLKNNGIVLSEKVVRRIMREKNLIAKTIKIRKYNSYHGEISPAVPNILQRDFKADKPNEKWVTDITEFSIPPEKYTFRQCLIVLKIGRASCRDVV